jgi:hypothetical protein
MSRNNGQNNGSAPLREVLEEAIALSWGNYSMGDLTVLAPQNDPYRLDTPAGHRDGKWFAEVIERLVPSGDAVHLRGLHYRLVVAGDVIRPDNGLPYVSSEECWKFLSQEASKAGRWLGYVPFERIIDERNAEPVIYIAESHAAKIRQANLSAGTFSDQIQIPLYARPGFWFWDSPLPQPYRIILFGEKTSLEPILQPIAETVGGELLLPTGEASDTMIAEMAARCAEDSRPAVVLYFSDFDPSGFQMPISVSRKLQALRDLRHPDLDIQVHHVALTLAQVREHGLPSTPLSETERRASKWRRVMGHEQTEIDALAALRPEILGAIARDAIKPFWDEP